MQILNKNFSYDNRSRRQHVKQKRKTANAFVTE